MDDSPEPRRTSLAGFRVDRVLRHDVWGRTTSLLGHFDRSPAGDDAAPQVPDAPPPPRAIVILKQEPWTLASIASISNGAGSSSADLPPAASSPQSLQLLSLLSAPGSLELTMSNDAYSYYKTAAAATAAAPAEGGGGGGGDSSSSSPGGPAGAPVSALQLLRAKVELIEPCTWWHVGKYEEKQVVLLRETPALYARLTLPYIASLPPKKLQWLFDILEGRKEQDRVLCSTGAHLDGGGGGDSGGNGGGSGPDDAHGGYMLVMYPSWKDAADHAHAFYIGIVRDRALRSLRDLTPAQLPLLRALRDGGLAAIERAHGLTRADVRAYFHYQPSFFHLHVHFRALGAHGDPSAAGAREFPLDEVIDNIELCGSYYQQRTLAFSSAAHPKLAAAFARDARDARGGGGGGGGGADDGEAAAAGAKAPPPSSLLLVLGLEALAAAGGGGKARPHLPGFLDFAFDHFAVALVTGGGNAVAASGAEAAEARAREVLGEERFARLQWCAAALAEGQLPAAGAGGALLVGVPPPTAVAAAAAAAAGATAAAAAHIGVLSLPAFSAAAAGPGEVGGGKAAALADTALSHGGRLRAVLWSSLHADASQLRRFAELRDPFS